jgi:phosphatidylethanolamine/phosphatidyl-N-methylethanolamine N-methyltransferase
MKKKPNYESTYIQEYDSNNSKKTISGYFLQKSHKLLEDFLPNNKKSDSILEVGAGTGHHYAYINRKPLKYILSDSSDDMLEIATKKYQNEINSGLIEVDKQNATKLTYADNSFDRLIATHVLEHILNPVDALEEWNRVVKPGGIISISLPCDPGMMWRLGRYFGPRTQLQKQGVNYDYLQAAEHVNSIFNLVVFIRHHFNVVVEDWYPLKAPVADLNLFYTCHIKVEKE